MNAGNTGFLLIWGTDPVAVALLIFLVTFLLEDAATIAAALLAAEGTISPPFALLALMVGVFLGDLALYAMGNYARSRAWIENLIGPGPLQQGGDWLKQRYVTALILARFMPGMRLPTFSASGFLGLHLGTFILVAFLAGVIWTSSVFTLIYCFGIAMANTIGEWRWIIAVALLALALIGPRIIQQRMKRRHSSHD